MRPAIRIENLSKRYRLGQRGGRGYRTLRESLTGAAAGVWQGVKRLGTRFIQPRPSEAARDPGEFWALKDVSFEVQPGEVVGIIGRNGAGKSTLLKILSRITEPTSGRAEIRGRLGSLLEVGTGFHPELTGRENVFLNGSILGMSHREITRRFDEIVAFSEVERFLDTPVKRYSSGMYVRLAFAVASHMNPEILVIDEVLAVGDASYQRRCIDRMAQLAASGVTILIVSHNMDLIPLLCDRAVALDLGKVNLDGNAKEVVAGYLESLRTEEISGDLRGATHNGDGRAIFTQVHLVDENNRVLVSHHSGDDLRLNMEVESTADFDDVNLAVAIKNVYGSRLVTSWTREAGFPVSLTRGLNRFQCRFREAKFRPGHRILIALWMATQSVMDDVDHALLLDVDPGETTRHLSTDAAQGIVVFDYDWSRVPCDPE
jgi:lipopolysaccharide transport system ATP-binding protein